MKKRYMKHFFLEYAFHALTHSHNTYFCISRGESRTEFRAGPKGHGPPASSNLVPHNQKIIKVSLKMTGKKVFNQEVCYNDFPSLHKPETPIQKTIGNIFYSLKKTNCWPLNIQVRFQLYGQIREK